MFARLFLAHPRSIGETYAEHQRQALAVSGALFVAAGAALAHAVVPAICERTASRIIKELNARVTQRTR
jgi:hypothetical protein